MLPMPLSLGFSTSDRTSATSGAPVAFGAVSFRGNATGGGSAPYTVDQSGSASSTAIPISASLPGAGGGIGGDLLGTAIPAALATGLNGNQVQDPVRAAQYAATGQLEEGDGAPGSMFGGLPVMGLLGLGAAAIAAFFIMGR